MCQSDQYSCPVHVTYESTELEYPDKFVVEPINYILIPSMSKEIYMGQWVLALGKLVRTNLVSSQGNVLELEVTFPGSRAIAEGCRRGSE